MTKRGMWYMNCLLWAGIWFVLGVLFIPFWLFSVLSLMLMLLPVGVSDTPKPYNGPTRHNPNEWRKQ